MDSATEDGPSPEKSSQAILTELFEMFDKVAGSSEISKKSNSSESDSASSHSCGSIHGKKPPETEKVDSDSSGPADMQNVFQAKKKAKKKKSKKKKRKMKKHKHKHTKKESKPSSKDANTDIVKEVLKRKSDLPIDLSEELPAKRKVECEHSLEHLDGHDIKLHKCSAIISESSDECSSENHGKDISRSSFKRRTHKSSHSERSSPLLKHPRHRSSHAEKISSVSPNQGKHIPVGKEKSFLPFSIGSQSHDFHMESDWRSDSASPSSQNNSCEGTSVACVVGSVAVNTVDSHLAEAALPTGQWRAVGGAAVPGQWKAVSESAAELGVDCAVKLTQVARNSPTDQLALTTQPVPTTHPVPTIQPVLTTPADAASDSARCPVPEQPPATNSTLLVPPGKAPRRGGIVIKSLKNSSVFEDTVRRVEEEARRRQAERAQHYEDGELSDSSPERSPAVVSALPPGDEKATETTDGNRKVVENHSEEDAKKAKRSKHKEKRSHRHDREKDGHRKEKAGSSRRKSSDRSHKRCDRSPRAVRRSRSSHSERHHSSLSRRSRSRSRDQDRDRDRGRSPSRERSRDRGDRDRGRGDLRERIDKQRLLEVARHNVQRMVEAGYLSAGSASGACSNVRELTEMCRRLRDEPAGGRRLPDDETGFCHPFAVKERPSHIVMKIRNAPQLAIKSHRERQAEVMKFPVSGGEQHRTKELEWVPVEPERRKHSEQKNEANATTESVSADARLSADVDTSAAEEAPIKPQNTDSVFPEPPRDTAEVDLNTIVSRRLTALRQLQQDPHSSQAHRLMSTVQEDIQSWAAQQHQPGQFTGSTGVRVLSAAQLSSGQQAWAKKSQLLRSAPVQGGMGEMLLKKMGWQPGQGLGKNKDGQLTPLLLEVKVDKRGLVSEDERPGSRRQAQLTMSNIKDLSGKHPISALTELCTKRRWGPPNFELSLDRGPPHSKHFLYKVTVNSVTYQPSVASPNKKLARAGAAAACLQALGLLPPKAEA